MSNKVSLFSLSQYHAQLFAYIEQNEGEIDDVLAHQLAITEDAVSTKTGRILDFLEQINSNIDMAKAREAQAATYRKQQERIAERLKGILTFGVEQFGELNSETRVVKFRKSQSVEIADTATLPLEYRRQKITFEPKKDELMKALRAGEKIEGVTLKDNKNLVIK